ncbi:BamA/TamA family outer membrane protein [Mesorhizobium atlanticum]
MAVSGRWLAGTSGDHLGGSTYFNASAEAQFPLPVIPESFGLRGAVFADAATLYGNNLVGVDLSFGRHETSRFGWCRLDVGLSLFGPIRIDYAIPVKKESTDKTQEFNFGIATRF